ncbi:hypothetical protein WJX74_001969 [Apatococcus lobatus]|uniref:Dol-P-Glc:Glc(2)Man(9)GlcNAc(2)-PP-Dol alpha-1,2-glucosyltransferase n=1 Tax=Apatococcus lobatus TaxID=904363 RepID=A0AAW1R2D7_9CHLO
MPQAQRKTNWTIIAYAGLLGVLVAIGGLISKHVPDAYMDEPFHVDQTEAYCAWDFKYWNPKITTFPGLYILGAAYAHVLSLLSAEGLEKVEDNCDTITLRSCTMLMGILSFWLFSQIHEELHPDKKGAYAMTLAGVAILQPLHFFFLFLYYTDAGSTAMILAAYLACLRSRYGLAALACAAATAFRQTNAVWAAFILGVAVLQHTLGTPTSVRRVPLQGELDPSAPEALAAVPSLKFSDTQQQQSNGRRPMIPAATESPQIATPSASAPSATSRTSQKPPINGGKASASAAKAAKPSGLQPLKAAATEPGSSRGEPRRSLWHDLRKILGLAWECRMLLALQLWSLAAVPIAFLGFMVYNGGIVVGDRTAHAPALHLAQPLYCLLFILGSLAPYHLNPSRLQGAWNRLKQHHASTWACLAVGAGALSSAIAVGTIAHPYLLADNRHYTFYLWRRVMMAHPAVPYALVPVYMYAAWSIHDSLTRRQSQAWIAGLAAGTCITLMPAALLELRYYIVPFMLVLLHMEPMSRWQLAGVGIIFAIINGATIWTFAYDSFTAPDGSVGRFMW